MKLYQTVRKRITEGVYPYGTKLPSKRNMASEQNVSVITVEHAYGILCDEGYVESRQRSGYFVAYRKSDFASVPEQKAFFVPPVKRNDSDESFPFSVFSGTMRNVLTKYGENVLTKSPNAGCMELRRAISSYLARSRDITVSPNQIVIGSGAEYLYGLIVQLLGRNRVYALENPSYEKIRAVYEGNGAKCDMLTMGQDGILSSELYRTGATCLHVTPFHSYPSGVTATASKRNEYLEWAKKRNGFIVEDDFDSEFTVSKKHEETVFSLDDGERVIYVNTFSKTVAPSMRVGYMVLPEQMGTWFSEKIGFYSCTVPVFEQYVLAELIESGDFERHINRVRRKRRTEKHEAK